MAITIKVELNGESIAYAEIVNVSDLAALSDYDFAMTEKANDALGILHFYKRGSIRQHKRQQSVWALVRKVAEQAAS